MELRSPSLHLDPAGLTRRFAPGKSFAAVVVGWHKTKLRRATNRQICDGTTALSERNQLDHAYGVYFDGGSLLVNRLMTRW